MSAAKMFRAAVGAIAAAASSVADEKHVDELKESIRVAAGDAVRIAREGFTDATATVHHNDEAAINNISSMFFQIMSLEIRSQENLRERLRAAEAELDFASAQLRRRDAYLTTLRDDMLREVQAANELVRVYVTKYNDLVADRSNAANQGSGGTAASFKRPTASSFSKVASAGVDATSNCSSNASTPKGPSPVAFPKLVEAKDLEKRLDAEREVALADPEGKSSDQSLREQMERRVKEIQIRLQREHQVLLHRTAKRGEDALKTETAKLEAKVRQLEQQLRRKEADAEIQLQKERDRWRVQLQRATETAKAGVLTKLWVVVGDVEKARMEMHDAAGHHAGVVESLLKKIRLLEQRVDAYASSGGDGGEESRSARGASIWFTPGGDMSVAGDTTGDGVKSSASSGAFLAPTAPQLARGSQQRSSRKVSVANSQTLMLSPNEGGPLSPRPERSPKKRGARRASSSARASFASPASSRLGPTDEIAALREAAETLRRNLTIALLARDEAIAERDALAEELGSSSENDASSLLLRLKSLKPDLDDDPFNPLQSSGRTKTSPTEKDGGIGAMMKAAETELKKLIAEFAQARNTFLVSQQTKVYAQLRRASGTSPRPLSLTDEGGITRPAPNRTQSMHASFSPVSPSAAGELPSPQQPYRLESTRYSSPIEDFGDAFKVVSMTPQIRPASAGRLRSSPQLRSSNSTPLEPQSSLGAARPPLSQPPAGGAPLDDIPLVMSPRGPKGVTFV